jgi:hypothetical protein
VSEVQKGEKLRFMKVYAGYIIDRACINEGYSIDKSRTYVNCNIDRSHNYWYFLVQDDF